MLHDSACWKPLYVDYDSLCNFIDTDCKTDYVLFYDVVEDLFK